MIQTVLKEAPVKRLGTRSDGLFRTPLEVITGVKPNRNTKAYIELPNVLLKDKAKVISTLLVYLDQLHEDVEQLCNKKLSRARYIHNKKKNIKPKMFCVGEFVMVHKATEKGHKLSYKWTGSRHIVNVISEVIYDI